mgnify:CR=1 FL=1
MARRIRLVICLTREANRRRPICQRTARLEGGNLAFVGRWAVRKRKRCEHREREEARQGFDNGDERALHGRSYDEANRLDANRPAMNNK